MLLAVTVLLLQQCSCCNGFLLTTFSSCNESLLVTAVFSEQVVGRSRGGEPVTTDDLGVSGALCVLMKVCAATATAVAETRIQQEGNVRVCL